MFGNKIQRLRSNDVGSETESQIATKRAISTELRFILCMWLGEISSCSFLTVLPGSHIPPWELTSPGVVTIKTKGWVLTFRP